MLVLGVLLKLLFTKCLMINFKVLRKVLKVHRLSWCLLLNLCLIVKLRVYILVHANISSVMYFLLFTKNYRMMIVLFFVNCLSWYRLSLSFLKPLLELLKLWQLYSSLLYNWQ